MSQSSEVLWTARNAAGGWGYAPDGETATEPTALAILGLGGEPAVGAVGALTALRRADGAFVASAAHQEASWATALGGMALARLGYAEQAQAAAQALLGEPVYVPPPIVETVYGFNTQVAGWPWTWGDYSFVEPTAFAVLFLKQMGHGGHSRVRQGVQMLRDRALPSGGWNYGEPVVLGSELYPAVMPTSLALLALADEPDATTQGGIDWLVGRQGAPMGLLGLAWAALALRLTGGGDWSAELATAWADAPAGQQDPLRAAVTLLAELPVAAHPLATTGVAV